MWTTVEDGKTIHTRGTENGTIIQDEEYQKSCRITLEKGTVFAPYSITCGVYGLMFHTAFTSTKDSAIEKYEEMKTELKKFLEAPSGNESDWCSWFTNKF